MPSSPGSYGFAFTVYDLYTVDPTVFALVALLAWCWLNDRWGIAATIAVVGIFGKETLAVMSIGLALARVPATVAILAAVTSALITTRAATATEWLPATKYLLLPGIAMAIAVVWYRRTEKLEPAIRD